MKTIKMLVLALCAALLLLAAIRPVQVLAAQPHGWNAGDNLSRSILHPIGWISLTIGYAGSGGAEGVVTAVDTAQPAAFGLLISLAGALILALGVFVLSRRKA